MKKLLAKDRKNRNLIRQLELKHFILKQISTNSNFLKTIKWNAFKKLSNLPKNTSKTIISKKCIKTLNKKPFHKFTNFSRTAFLKLARLGNLSYLKKSSW